MIYISPKYSTIEKKCQEVGKWAVLTHYYCHLGQAFTLCLNHAPLKGLHRIKDANVQITQWNLGEEGHKDLHRWGIDANECSMLH